MKTISLRSKSSVYDHYAIPASQRAVIHGFTANAVTKIYQGTLRGSVTALGYSDRAVTITDQSVLNAIDTFAAERADKIINGTNARLSNALAKLPENLTDEQLHTGLAEWRAETKAYNRDVMIPYTNQWAKGTATTDFARNNQGVLDQLWIVEPSETDQTDECEEAISLGEMPTAIMLQYEFPAHQNCPHEFVATQTLTAELPDISDLWIGGDAGMAFDLSADENNAQWASGLTDEALRAQLQQESTTTGGFDQSTMNALLSEAAQRGKVPDFGWFDGAHLNEPTPEQGVIIGGMTAQGAADEAVFYLLKAHDASGAGEYAKGQIQLEQAALYHMAAHLHGYRIDSDGNLITLKNGKPATKPATAPVKAPVELPAIPAAETVPHTSPTVASGSIYDALAKIKGTASIDAVMPELRLLAEQDRFINTIGGLSSGLAKVNASILKLSDYGLGSSFLQQKAVLESSYSTDAERLKAQRLITQTMLAARSRGFTFEADGSKVDLGAVAPKPATPAAPVTINGAVVLNPLQLSANKPITPTAKLGVIKYGYKYSQAEIDVAYPDPQIATAYEISRVKSDWNSWPTPAHFIAMELEFGVRIENWQRPKVDSWIAEQKKTDEAGYNKQIDLYRRAMRQDYINDQRAMMRAGIESITLARGINFSPIDTPAEWHRVKTGDVVAFPAQPLNSFSTRRAVAERSGFGAKGVYNRVGYVMNAEVPREWILSRDGWGLGAENEIPVIGGQHTLQVGIDNVGGSQPKGTPRPEAAPAPPLEAPQPILSPAEKMVKALSEAPSAESAFALIKAQADDGKFLKDGALATESKVSSPIAKMTDQELLAHVSKYVPDLTIPSEQETAARMIGQALLVAQSRGFSIDVAGKLTKLPETNEQLAKHFSQVTTVDEAKAYALLLAEKGKYLTKEKTVVDGTTVPEFIHEKSDAELTAYVQQQHEFLAAYNLDPQNMSRLGRALIEAMNRGLVINPDGTLSPKGTKLPEPEPVKPPEILTPPKTESEAWVDTSALYNGFTKATGQQHAFDAVQAIADAGKFIDYKVHALVPATEIDPSYHALSNTDLATIVHATVPHLEGSIANASAVGQAIIELESRGLTVKANGTLYDDAGALIPSAAEAKPSTTAQPTAYSVALEVAQQGQYLNLDGSLSPGGGATHFKGYTDEALLGYIKNVKAQYEDGNLVADEVQAALSKAYLEVLKRGYSIDGDFNVQLTPPAIPLPHEESAAAKPLLEPSPDLQGKTNPQLTAAIKASSSVEAVLPELRQLAANGKFINTLGGNSTGLHKVTSSLTKLSDVKLSERFLEYKHTIEDIFSSQAQVFTAQRMISQTMLIAHERGFTFEADGTITKFGAAPAQNGPPVSEPEPILPSPQALFDAFSVEDDNAKAFDLIQSLALDHGSHISSESYQIETSISPAIHALSTPELAAVVKKYAKTASNYYDADQIGQALLEAKARGYTPEDLNALETVPAAPFPPPLSHADNLVLIEFKMSGEADQFASLALKLAHQGSIITGGWETAVVDHAPEPGAGLAAMSDLELAAHVGNVKEQYDEGLITANEVTARLGEIYIEALNRNLTITPDGTIELTEKALPEALVVEPPVTLNPPQPAPEYVPTILPSGALLPKPQAPTPEDEHLRSGTFSGLVNLNGGANDVFSAKLTAPDGTAHQVVVKDNPNHTHHMRGDINPGGDFDREISAVVLNKALGDLVFIPTTIRRETEQFGDSLVMDFVAGNQKIGHSYGPAAEENALAIFDAVMGNLDRHSGNALLYTGEDGQQHIASIDHGLSFPALTWKTSSTNQATLFMDRHGGEAIPQAIHDKLVDLLTHWDTVSANLAQTGLRQTDLDALRIRTAWMVDHGIIPKTFSQITGYSVDPSTHEVLKAGAAWKPAGAVSAPAEPVATAPKPVSYGLPLPPLTLNAQIKASTDIAAVLPLMRQLASLGKFINSIGGNSTGIHKVASSIVKMSDADLSKAFLGHKATIESALSTPEAVFASQRQITQIMLAASERGFTFEADGSRIPLTAAKQIAAPASPPAGVTLLPEKPLEDRTPRTMPTPAGMKALDDAGLLDLYHTLKNAVSPDLPSLNALMDQIASRGKVLSGGKLVEAGSSVWIGVAPADLARAAEHTLLGISQVGTTDTYLEALSQIHAAAAQAQVHLSDDGRFLTDLEVGAKTPANAFAEPPTPAPAPELTTPEHPYLAEDPAVHDFLAETAPSLLHGLIDAGTADVNRLAAKANARPKWNEKITGTAEDASQLKADLAARGKTLGITIIYDSKETLQAAGAGTARGYVKPGSKVIHVDATLDPQLQATVIAHEMGHLLDQIFSTEASVARWKGLSSPDNYAHNEIIAESFSNLIAKLYHVDSDSHAVGYTAQYAHGSLDGAAALHAERDRVLQLLDHFLSTDTTEAELKPTGPDRLVAQAAPDLSTVHEAALAERFQAERVSTAYDPVAVNATLNEALSRGLMFKTDDGSLVPAKAPAILHAESTDAELAQLVVSTHDAIAQALAGGDHAAADLGLRRLGNLLWEGQQRGLEIEADGNLRKLERTAPSNEVTPATAPVWDHVPAQTLSTGHLTDIETLGGGVHTTLTARLVQADGSSVAVFLKPQSGLDPRQLRVGVDPASDLPREVAAGIVNEALGGLVEMPAVIQRDLSPYGPSVVEELIANARILGSQLAPKTEGHAGAVFDALIGNLDRKADNAMLRTDTAGTDHLVMIDHGMSFPLGAQDRERSEYNGLLMSQFGGTPLTAPERAAVQALHDSFYPATYEALRAAGIGPEEADDVNYRATWMLEHNQVPAEFAAIF